MTGAEPEPVVVLVTPELAAAWLAAHDAVAGPPRAPRVGAWRPGCAAWHPVRLSSGGLIMDGTHRLAAIVATGTAARLDVILPQLGHHDCAAAAEQLAVGREAG